MYSSVVNVICHDVLMNKDNQFTKITSADRVNLLLRSRIFWGIYTYYVNSGSEDFLVVFPDKEKLSHIVPGLAHAYLISIIFLCDAVCKEKYNENICSVYYSSKLVRKGGRELKTRLWIFTLQECNSTF